MEMSKVEEYARALYNAHGDKAEAEAAQKMRECTEQGKTKEAEDWGAIRASIRSMRGAYQG